MALRAEWDPATKNVIRIENDDEQPGGLHSGYTGADRASGSDTEWYPLEIEYPETYVPRFPHLLGPARAFLEDGKVVQRFLHADYSEAAVRGALADEVKRAARVALADTDWYYVRKLDTKQAVPAHVEKQRAAIREAADARIEEVQAASPSALLDFNASIAVDGRIWTSRG